MKKILKFPTILQFGLLATHWISWIIQRNQLYVDYGITLQCQTSSKLPLPLNAVSSITLFHHGCDI